MGSSGSSWDLGVLSRLQLYLGKPGQEGQGRSSLLCASESHWVNTLVSREEELQSGSGVNADGATGHAAQSKQNKVGGEGLALGGGCTSLSGLGSSLGSCCHGHGFWAAKDFVAVCWALKPQGRFPFHKASPAQSRPGGPAEQPCLPPGLLHRVILLEPCLGGFERH